VPVAQETFLNARSTPVRPLDCGNLDPRSAA
jgi:hypothetical protein